MMSSGVFKFMNRTTEGWLLDPPPESAAARARDFGIDLTLLVGRLKLSPEERLDDLQRVIDDIECARAGARMRREAAR
jgi:hypothetical protein